MKNIAISVIIPIYNEEATLLELFERLTSVMDPLKRPYEILFINDGSKDRSMELLSEFFQRRPEVVRVIDFNGNYGQHIAIIAAFERARGETIITLDGDLQNPPEEIPKLLTKINEGYDVVGGHRKKRKDNIVRKGCSRFLNVVRQRFSNIKMTDQGCMLRAYRKHIVKAIAATEERATFIPALAYKFATRPCEVEVEHCSRKKGASKYNYYKLIRLNFDLITGFTLVPLQLFTLFGFAASLFSLILMLILAYRRIFFGTEANGIFTLFALLFFLLSVAIAGIGLLGEYVGRTYQAVQKRPRYILKQMLEKKDE